MKEREFEFYEVLFNKPAFIRHKLSGEKVRYLTFTESELIPEIDAYIKEKYDSNIQFLLEGFQIDMGIGIVSSYAHAFTELFSERVKELENNTTDQEDNTIASVKYASYTESNILEKLNNLELGEAEDYFGILYHCVPGGWIAYKWKKHGIDGEPDELYEGVFIPKK